MGITDTTERKTVKLLIDETVIHFREIVKKIEYRYEVTLPWLAGQPPVYGRSDAAEKRLRLVTKRLLKENNYEVYDHVFRQWQLKVIIEVVSENEISKLSHYLPHRPAVKFSSVTTEIRSVFGASFKRQGYAYLIERLSVGPNLSQQIP